mmetsp:Transcript_8589/g.14546  ORF Transcript_8589/g.14546 Transcript_8589/m.14546 type:complete len:1837 (-) Transcript_8589:4-5514(-)
MFKIIYFWLLFNFTFLVSFGGEFVEDEKKVEVAEEAFPFEELGKEDNYSTDVQEEENLSTLSELLRSNIEQWHLAETQLSDPEIHLAMPDISTPLQQLSMTLEILGSIYITQGNFVKARDTLEKACPLIELIAPPSTRDVLSFPAAEDSTYSRISPPQSQKQVEQFRHCIVQLKEVYSQLSSSSSDSMDLSSHGLDRIKSVRSPYQRLRAEFELRKFLKGIVTVLETENESSFLNVKHDIQRELQEFVHRYVHDFDGKIPTLLDIFERAISVSPREISESVIASLQDMMDESMDVVFKQVWEDSSSQRLHNPHYRDHAAEGGDLLSSPSTPQTLSPSSTGSTPPSRGPSLAAAPAPGVSSPSTLEPVIHGHDSVPLTEKMELPRQDKAIIDMVTCLQAGDRDCSKLPFPNSKDLQRIKDVIMSQKITNSLNLSPGNNGAVFNKDGTLKQNVLEKINQAFPLDKRKTSPSVGADLSGDSSGSNSNGQSKQASQGRKAGFKKRQKRNKGKSEEDYEGNGDSFDRVFNQSIMHSEEGSVVVDVDLAPDGTNANISDLKSTEKTGSTRGGFSRKPTPVIPNATAYAPPPGLQMNLVFWQWVRMQPPQPTPLANVKVEAPSPTKASVANSQSSSSQAGGRNDGLRLNSETAGVLFESSTTAGQNSAPRAAVSNVRANNTAIFALVFSIIALCLGVAYLNYSQQSSSSLRRKPKRTPKRTFSQYVEDSVEYSVQVSQEIVYPFLCYLVKQFVGLFVSSYSKLIEYMSRKAVPATTAKDNNNINSNSRSSKGSSVIPPAGNGNGSMGKKSSSTSSGSASGVSTLGRVSIGPVSVSSTEDVPPPPVLTSILSTSSTSSNTSTGSNKSSKKKSPPNATCESSTKSNQNSSSTNVDPGSGSKQVRFTKETAPPAPLSVSPVAPSAAVDSSKTTKSSAQVKSSEEPMSKKPNSGNKVTTPTQGTPASSTSTKSTKVASPLVPNGTTNKVASIAKKSTAAVTPSSSSASSVSAVGKSSAVNDNGANNKNSPKSVVVPTPPSTVSAQAATVATAPAGKKKGKTAATTSSSRSAGFKTTPDTVKPTTVVQASSSSQENAWKKIDGGKSDSMSPRPMNTQASVDSYDELLHHMKQTTVDSISVDEEEEKSKTEKVVTNKSSDRSDKSRKKSMNVPKAGSKPFPFPSPIIIGATPPIALAPSCDISPHSALRIAPGISSGSYAMNTGTSSNSSTATSPSSSSPGSTPIAMTLKLSPKVSAMVNAIPELEKAPSEIAPGLSDSLLPPAVVSNVDSTVNDNLIDSGNSYPRVLSDSLLVALNESAPESLDSVPALGGLGLLSASNRLSDTSAGSGGSGDGNGGGKIDDSDINFYEASPMFPLQSLDGLNTTGGIHGTTTNPPPSTPAYGLGQGNSVNHQQLSSVGGPQSNSSGGNVNSSDGDIFVQDFFSDLSKDSPVFCSANYPASTPPGMSSRGLGVPANNNESDATPYSEFPRRGLGESLGDFDFSTQSNLGDHESLDGVSGIGYGLFGSRHSNSFRRENEQHNRDAEEVFWKKNTQNSKMLLGSSLLDDDCDDDDMFHFASQGDHLDKDFFHHDNDKYDDLMQPSRWHDDHSTRHESIGGGRGGEVVMSHGAPPGFNSVGQNSLDHSEDLSNGLSRDLLAYAPQNRSNSRIGGGHARDDGSMMSHDQMSHVQSTIPRQSHSHDSHDADNGSQSHDILTLTFTVRCAVDFRHQMQVASVSMASSLFGGWSVDQALPMRRSAGKDDVYGINVEVPSYLPHFTFKYIITDVEGNMWMEHGGPVVMNVSQRLQREQRQKGRHNLSDARPVLHQEDVLMSYVSIPPGPFLYGNGN